MKEYQTHTLLFAVVVIFLVALLVAPSESYASYDYGGCTTAACIEARAIEKGSIEICSGRVRTGNTQSRYSENAKIAENHDDCVRKVLNKLQKDKYANELLNCRNKRVNSCMIDIKKPGKESTSYCDGFANSARKLDCLEQADKNADRYVVRETLTCQRRPISPCILELAKRTKDASICDLYFNNKNCIEEMTLLLNDDKLCENINSASSDQCYRQIAEQRQDITLCKKSKKTDKGFCKSDLLVFLGGIITFWKGIFIYFIPRIPLIIFSIIFVQGIFKKPPRKSWIIGASVGVVLVLVAATTKGSFMGFTLPLYFIESLLRLPAQQMSGIGHDQYEHIWALWSLGHIPFFGWMGNLIARHKFKQLIIILTLLYGLNFAGFIFIMFAIGSGFR